MNSMCPTWDMITQIATLEVEIKRLNPFEDMVIGLQV